LVEGLLEPLRVSRPALALRTTETRSLGSEALLVVLHHGAAATRILTKVDRQLPGLEIAVVATTIIKAVTVPIATTDRLMQVPQVPLLPGRNRLLELRVGMLVILAMVPTVLLPEWELLLALVLLAVHPLLLVLPQAWETLTPLFSSMPALHLLLRLLEMPRHHLPVISLRLPHLPVPKEADNKAVLFWEVF
jgi:hypothetical protein